MSVYSEVQASDDLVNQIITMWQASPHSGVTIHGNNGPKPNLDELKQVVNFELEFSKSEQATISPDPIDRTWGYVEFFFGVREGVGIRSVRTMKSYVKAQMKAKTFGKVKTLIPSSGRPERVEGWLFETLYVPFYFDSQPIANSTP